MTICTSCKKNVAVVFTTRIESGHRFNEGLCIKCAYESGLGGLDGLLRSSGINENNIDEITERLNSFMSNSDFQSPESILKSLIKGFKDDISTETDSFEEQDNGDNSSLIPVSSVSGSDSDDDSESNGNIVPGDGKELLRKKPISVKENNRQLPKRKFLDQFGANLTLRASEGKVDRIIGRQKELDRVIQILNRRSKNNPVLLGEPGVGKTAIAEGLAVRISEGKVPVKLRGLEVYLLDLTAMVAGTQFRGQFEGRMKGVVDDAKRSGNIVLVIDELHNIMGAGDAEGAMNAGNILKPALAKGDIKVLGSTTLNEYRKFIEKDSALERRFQQVLVDEPDIEDSVSILMGVKDYYEEHHSVRYDEDVIRAAVILSERYITDRFLPDKAIDLIDEAGSRANLRDEKSIEIYESAQRIDSLESSLNSIGTVLSDKDDGEKLYEYQAELKSKICREKDRYDKLVEAHTPVLITIEDIASVVEMWTGVPVQRISEDESDKLLKLEERLRQRVIGQNQAVEALASAIRRKRAGFSAKHKPSSFIFVGPTGVGKTELVKTLAWAVFGSEDNMIRLDMSEFMESHTVSKMIGSPPGYVGFDDGGQLTEKVRRKPYSVILFDEIEKAHADVYNMLLQILDDGRLTDSHGRMVNFENTIIIMTSNAGTTLKGNSIGFGSTGHTALENRVDTVLKEIFRPEFLNRVDEIVVFNELSKDDLRRICDLMLKDVFATLAEKGIRLVVSDEVKDHITEKGYDSKFGARPLRKTIRKLLEDPLTDLLLKGSLDGAIGISATLSNDLIEFEIL
ncbi:MAG: ATP-dependent Clp protease ATP-binding subunit [Eubacteriales bacterium]|nr:ATP-dependent Clp protease ATP-binding subunit [Eubacteriales bacterium]MDD4327216.1 ATP-dependent Clp protease ATP-binding subunit [Eubacteriales bacterium]MDD4717456.1 ATP-dependent Clp protease ATP-binding subunit [Eubacteriales bacterium]